ncbi:MAG TPA: energy transducer TonB [Terracidiphilus sp.]|nr:energy transducer TonB [Terracidiphilus sp.]
MRNPLLAALLAAVCATAWAQSNSPDPQRLLDAAEQRSDLFHRATQPFVLEADVTAQLNVRSEGQLLIRWGAKDKWRQEIKLGPFAMVKTKNGENTLTLRNVPYTPQRVKDLAYLLEFANGDLGYTVRDLKRRKDGGQDVNCISYVETVNLQQQTLACLDTATNNVLSLSEDRKAPAVEKRREEFSDFADFDGMRYPRQLRLFANGSLVLSVRITKLAPEPFDDKFLALPPEAIARRECKGEIPPKPLNAPEAELPPGAPSGGVSVALTVLANGSVSDIHVAGTSSSLLNDAALKAVMAYKFRPAMCGPEPVVFDATIEINFRRY